MIILAALLLGCALLLTGPNPALRIPPAALQPTETKPRDGPVRTTLHWLEAKLREHRSTPQTDPLAAAADLELYAACVESGLSPAHAAAAVATASNSTSWRRTASLLELGITAEKAWAELYSDPHYAQLAALATNSQRSGAALAHGCRDSAEKLRQEDIDHATARAERAGVLIALPLTLCYLPAFFLLGLAPVVLELGLKIITT